jgi:hypothetical protein
VLFADGADDAVHRAVERQTPRLHHAAQRLDLLRQALRDVFPRALKNEPARPGHD